MKDLKSFVNVLFPKYRRNEEINKRIEENHIDAALKIVKTAKDFYPKYTIDKLFILEVNIKDKNEENYYLKETSFQKRLEILAQFRDGKGTLLLLSDHYKKKISNKTFYIYENGNNPVPVAVTGDPIPDFSYTLTNGEYYYLSLKKNYNKINIKEQQDQFELLYRQLYYSLNKEISIDHNFETAGCYESYSILKYFRLSYNQLYIVIEHQGETISHLFNHIEEVKHSLSYSNQAYKFWLYGADFNYRLFLFKQENEKDAPVDPGIFQVSKLL